MWQEFVVFFGELGLALLLLWGKITPLQFLEGVVHLAKFLAVFIPEEAQAPAPAPAPAPDRVV